MFFLCNLFTPFVCTVSVLLGTRSVLAPCKLVDLLVVSTIPPSQLCGPGKSHEGSNAKEAFNAPSHSLELAGPSWHLGYYTIAGCPSATTTFIPQGTWVQSLSHKPNGCNTTMIVDTNTLSSLRCNDNPNCQGQSSQFDLGLTPHCRKLILAVLSYSPIHLHILTTICSLHTSLLSHHLHTRFWLTLSLLGIKPHQLLLHHPGLVIHLNYYFINTQGACGYDDNHAMVHILSLGHTCVSILNWWCKKVRWA